MKIVKRVIFCILALIVAGVYSYGVWPRAIYDTDIGANSYENTGALEEGTVVKQQFLCTDDGMCGLKIKLTKQDSQTIGQYKWAITEQESGKEIGSGIIDESSTENKEFVSASAQERGNIELEVPLQKQSKDNIYVLSIEGSRVQEDETMAIYITEKGENAKELMVDKESIDKACVIKVEYKRFNVETFIVFVGIIIYLIVFVKFMYRLFR